MIPRYVLKFDDVEAAHSSQAGGKGRVLASLYLAGFPVPPGFIVTADAYLAFVAANLLDPSHDKSQIDRYLDTASTVTVEAVFEKGEMPLAVADAICDAYRTLGEGAVAVRSSALAEDGEAISFAGQHDSFLGMVGCDAVLDAVRCCWASLWSERAHAYRRSVGSGSRDTAMAVVIQNMVTAAQAGVAFTLDPTSGRRDVIVVEATAGTGEVLVSGQVTPHRYIVERGGCCSPVADELLDGERLADVVWLAQKVESWAGKAQDIEWALDKAGCVYLLQARAVTAAAGPQPSKDTTRWTRDNVGEVIPDPVTPLSWSVLGPLSNHSFTGMLRRLGVRSLSGACLFDRFYGRVYFNQSLFHGLVGCFYPSQAGWLAGSRLAWTGLKTLWSLYHLPMESGRIMGIIAEKNHSEVGLDRTATLDRLADWRRLGAAAMEVHWSVTLLADLLYKGLDKLIARWGNGTNRSSAASITTGLTGVLSAEAGQALAALARQVRTDEGLRSLVITTPTETLVDRLAETKQGRELWSEIQAYLDKHGYAAVQEFELSAPRWRDNPAVIMGALQAQVRAAAQKPPVEPVAARQAAVARIEGQLSPVKRWVFRRLLRLAQVFTITRENLKYHIVIAHGHLREIYMALAGQLVDAGRLANASDIFYLTAAEVTSLQEGGLTSEDACAHVTERRRAWELDRRAFAPAAFDQQDGHLHPVVAQVPSFGSDEQLLRGVGASPGVHVGRARVMLNLVDVKDLAPGEVLIAPATTPGWTPVMLSAGALVTEIGGLVSHSAIIAREYGLPAVLNVSGATQYIRTGQLVCVDGTQGIVQVMSE